MDLIARLYLKAVSYEPRSGWVTVDGKRDFTTEVTARQYSKQMQILRSGQNDMSSSAKHVILSEACHPERSEGSAFLLVSVAPL